MIIIDKNIPLNLEQQKYDTTFWRDLLPKMQVGDSVKLDIDTKDAIHKVRSLLSQEIRRKKIQEKFTVRWQKDGGYRVWRIA